jgi:hypothetical protein
MLFALLEFTTTPLVAARSELWLIISVEGVVEAVS